VRTGSAAPQPAQAQSFRSRLSASTAPARIQPLCSATAVPKRGRGIRGRFQVPAAMVQASSLASGVSLSHRVVQAVLIPSCL
jgi:hypothetical protein